MTATTRVPKRETTGRFTLGEVRGLLSGLARHGDGEIEARAVELERRATALIADIEHMIRRYDAGIETADETALHVQEPTFTMTGPGTGQPSGFRCDGCAQEWHVRPGQAAAELIPVLREHAAQVTRG